ncbi:MAG: pyridine nucleotide-disulfide oxidoreductase [Syntrophobacterales bacterium CG03_land_8_20_14_0_80_58_14]|nr:MAG: pyridine nucleotide-disulfide oxidoreductase [Syntrophobacterales bacterium CG03_land_8_20_14_0_80_58_14]
MSTKPTIIIPGSEKGARVDSRVLEERIQKAVADGHRNIEIIAQGQHGLGGRLWRAGNDPISIRILGTSGQRVGAMGFPNTRIDVIGPASDDVGWLNAGARITIRGNATNGVGNAMAQGKIYVAGDIGARGMTMTKHNPRFEPPELWVLGGVGDSFAEFMAGGVAVICGHGTQRVENVLGYRPCVGMVGGKIFFRGAHQGFSGKDARLTVPDDDEWRWLTAQMTEYLEAIGLSALLSDLTADRGVWQLLVARKPHEKAGAPGRNIGRFRAEVWDRELGMGGMIGDLTVQDRTPIGVIATGQMRRFVPLWENEKYLPPCQAHCPTGIPVRKRWELIRNGKMQEAVDLALAYTPFPATVCGYLCPNLCMQSCTRQKADLPAVDVTLLGRASLQAVVPAAGSATGRKIAVIGGGAAGLSVAWQLRMQGHEPVIHDVRKRLGGKITATIPRDRIPDEVLDHELKRLEGEIPHKTLKHPLTEEEFEKLREKFDAVVIAVGAQKARIIPFPGHERAVAALDFLRESKLDQAKVGKSVVVIGAGNVGCDAAAEAFRLGAEAVTLIDIQPPASSGVERKHAEAAGAKFLWPRFTKVITETAVELKEGEVLPADTVIMAVGDQPDLGFLPGEIKTERGFIVVDEQYRSSDPKVFAIGDAVRLGLLTEAIGAGRAAARAIDDMLRGRKETYDQLPAIDPERVKLEYYDPRLPAFTDPATCAAGCASCGACRDCGLCETLCPQNAISRKEQEGDAYEYVVDPDRCIGCGFCAGACPCGIWRLTENDPLE